MKPKRLKRWRIENREAPKSQWPITIVNLAGDQSDDDGADRELAPIWVWGDLKLAEKIVKLLNQ